jgi:hypothetical protein
MRRRGLLRLAGLGFAGFAGCSRRFDIGDGRSTTAETTGTAGTTAELPYRGESGQNLPDPRGVVVRNEGDRKRYVTVAGYDGDRTLFVRSAMVDAGKRRTYDDLVAKRGTYRLGVQTDDGLRAEREWVVAAAVDDPVVRIGDGVSVTATATCDPACDPLSVGGESAALPVGNGGNPATLRLSADERRRVAVTVERERRTLLDYEYDLRPGIAVEVPVTERSGTYEVTVRAGDREHSRTWPVPEVSTLHVSPGDGQVFSCGEATGAVRVVNATDVERELVVTISPDGPKTFQYRASLDPGSERVLHETAQSSGEYRLAAELIDDDGAESTTWWVCPPRPDATVYVTAIGTVRIRTGD